MFVISSGRLLDEELADCSQLLPLRPTCCAGGGAAALEDLDEDDYQSEMLLTWIIHHTGAASMPENNLDRSSTG